MNTGGINTTDNILREKRVKKIKEGKKMVNQAL